MSIGADIGSGEETIDLLAVVAILAVAGYLLYEIFGSGTGLHQALVNAYDSTSSGLAGLFHISTQGQAPPTLGIGAPGSYNPNIPSNISVPPILQSNGAATQAQQQNPTQPVSSLAGTGGTTGGT